MKTSSHTAPSRIASAKTRARIEAANDATVPRRGNPIVRAVGAAASAVARPPVMLAGAAIATGLLLRQPRIARTGLQMLTAELAASGARAVASSYAGFGAVGEGKPDGDGKVVAMPGNARSGPGPIVRAASQIAITAGLQFGVALLARRGRKSRAAAKDAGKPVAA